MLGHLQPLIAVADELRVADREQDAKTAEIYREAAVRIERLGAPSGAAPAVNVEVEASEWRGRLQP